ISSKMLDKVRADLSRPHLFAAERIGFLYGKLVEGPAPLVMMTGFEPVADDRYINDPMSGARIDSQAIRTAMQGVLDRGQGGFHVHMHHWPGRPALSKMDVQEIPPVVMALRRVGVAQAHGIVLLHNEQCASCVWLPRSKHAIAAHTFSIVGFHMQIMTGESYV